MANLRTFGAFFTGLDLCWCTKIDKYHVCKWEDFVARFKRNPKLKKELKKCPCITKILQILNLYKTFTQYIMTSSNILSFVLRMKRIISQKLLFRYKTLDESIGSGNYVVKAYEGIGPLGAGGGWVIQVIHHTSETSNTNIIFLMSYGLNP